MSKPAALVSTEWLGQHLNDLDVRIIESSYFVPGGVEKARELYKQDHIPGAIFFDINAVADTSKAKEHSFPSGGIFAAKVGELGLSNTDRIIAYDRMGGTCAAARAWFMFRAFGHDNIAVLDGGYTKWAAENRPLTKNVTSSVSQNFTVGGFSRSVASKDAVLENIKTRAFQVLDARSKGRFQGSEPEPRAGVRSGRIPGSCNLPFLSLINDADKTWKDPAVLRRLFADAGIDLDKPLTTTCGSGVTACALAFGAYLAGKDDTVIYDGSWLEWGSDPSLPLETGA